MSAPERPSHLPRSKAPVPSPGIPNAILERFCSSELLEEVRGDLDEVLTERLTRMPGLVARALHWWEVLFFFRAHVRRRRSRQPYARGPILLKNFLKVAGRNMVRRKGHAAINIGGLALGITCCLLIVLYVQDELGFDRHFPGADSIYRVVENEVVRDGAVIKHAATPSALAPNLAATFPAISAATRLYNYNGLVGRQDSGAQGLLVQFQEDQLYFVDSTFFEVFELDFLSGDVQSALREPMTVVLTQSAAQRYFGRTNPVGQVLTLDNAHDLRVSGLVRDLPEDTHFQFELLVSFGSLQSIEPWVVDTWWWPPMQSYVHLADGASAAELEAQFPNFTALHIGTDNATSRSFHLQKLTDIRLHSDRTDDPAKTGNVMYVYLFSGIAFLILLIACVNFINLVTAQASRRAREVGMRKVLGARRFQLVRQFLAESFLTVGLALLLALGLVIVSLPAFNQLAGKSLALDGLGTWMVPASLLAMVLIVGVLAGSYPALYLSAAGPIGAMRGMISRGGTAPGLRKSLVVFQFTISSVLIVGTVVIYNQLHYVQNKKLGFNREHVVAVPLRDSGDQLNHKTLKDMWIQDSRVASVTVSHGIPGLGDRSAYQVFYREPQRDSLYLSVLHVDHDFVQTLGLEIVAGRDFSPEFATDSSSAYLMNQAAAAQIGWSEPVGKHLTLNYKSPSAAFVDKPGTVVGVVRDFHLESLHSKIEPVLIHIVPGSFYSDYLVARIDGTNIRETLAALEAGWRAFSPDRPFEYSFLDTHYDALYRSEARLGALFSSFALLAIFIACLGLFGLASFVAQQRTKEIGVRKALGASVGGIVISFSKEFLSLVAAAFVVSIPVGYLIMDRWLSGFAYRVEIRWYMFLVAGVVALAIAALSVSHQAVRAARANPVDSLRCE